MNVKIISELIHSQDTLKLLAHGITYSTFSGSKYRQCFELLLQLEVEEEETLLAELQHLKEEEEALIQELETVEEQRAAVAQDLAQSRIHSQQLDTEELQ